MNLKNYISILLLFISVCITAQDLKCKDFKTGKFIGTAEVFPNVEWTIIRTKKTQMEWTSKIPQQYVEQGYPLDTIYANIHWKDNCGLHLIYKAKKKKLSDSQRVINEAGGIVVKKKKIEGNCYYYESTTKINGEDLILQGKVCKQSKR